MKAAVLAGVLVAVNVVWFGMMRTLWRKGVPITLLNTLQGLRSYRDLIEDTVVRNDRARLIFSLLAFYLFLGALAVGIFL